MGLDMLLTAELNYWRNWSRDENNQPTSTPPTGLLEISKTLALPSLAAEWRALLWRGEFALRPRIGYWRKANAIHAWFIRHRKEDDCQPFDVDIDDLLKLKAICQRIIDSPSQKLADELLPTKSGFFFGPTDLADPSTMERYLSYLRDTVAIVDKAQTLAVWFHGLENDNPAKPCWLSFKYHASW